MLLGDDVAAVRAPRRLVEQAEVLLRHLALVAAIDVHDPDVVAAAAVGREGDPPSVRRKARLVLVRQAIRDPGRRATGNRHGVDVAEQVERDRAPILRHVDVHPAALIGRDPDLARGHAGRGGDVPLLRLGGGTGRRSSRRGRWQWPGHLVVGIGRLILGRLRLGDRRRLVRRRGVAALREGSAARQNCRQHARDLIPHR